MCQETTSQVFCKHPPRPRWEWSTSSCVSSQDPPKVVYQLSFKFRFMQVSLQMESTISFQTTAQLQKSPRVSAAHFSQPCMSPQVLQLPLAKPFQWPLLFSICTGMEKFQKVKFSGFLSSGSGFICSARISCDDLGGTTRGCCILGFHKAKTGLGGTCAI